MSPSVSSLAAWMPARTASWSPVISRELFQVTSASVSVLLTTYFGMALMNFAKSWSWSVVVQ